MLGGTGRIGHLTPGGPGMSSAEDDTAAAFRSPSPEDADAVRVGSPRDDGDGEGGLQQATPQRSARSPLDAASPADAAAGSAPQTGGLDTGAAIATLPQDVMPALTPASRAVFPGFALGQGQHLVIKHCKAILAVEPPLAQ